jgi:hypothetical protein
MSLPLPVAALTRTRAAHRMDLGTIGGPSNGER